MNATAGARCRWQLAGPVSSRRSPRLRLTWSVNRTGYAPWSALRTRRAAAMRLPLSPGSGRHDRPPGRSSGARRRLPVDANAGSHQDHRTRAGHRERARAARPLLSVSDLHIERDPAIGGASAGGWSTNAGNQRSGDRIRCSVSLVVSLGVDRHRQLAAVFVGEMGMPSGIHFAVRGFLGPEAERLEQLVRF
jgi:hypothetical protein